MTITYHGCPRNSRNSVHETLVHETLSRKLPQLYLTQLLMNLPAARMNELSVWLPDQWKQLHVARIASKQAPPACCVGIGSPSAHDKAVHLGSKITK